MIRKTFLVLCILASAQPIHAQRPRFEAGLGMVLAVALTTTAVGLAIPHVSFWVRCLLHPHHSVLDGDRVRIETAGLSFRVPGTWTPLRQYRFQLSPSEILGRGGPNEYPGGIQAGPWIGFWIQ